MDNFKWTSRNLITLPEFDAEHEMLFEIGARLERESRADADVTRLGEILAALRTHAGEHFAHEERLMRSTKCPSYRWHKRQHERVAREVLRLQQEIESGNSKALPRMLKSLSEQLNGHIRLTDRMMAAHLRNYGLAHAAKAS